MDNGCTTDNGHQKDDDSHGKDDVHQKDEDRHGKDNGLQKAGEQHGKEIEQQITKESVPHVYSLTKQKSLTERQQNNLELVSVKNSHNFVDEYLKRPEFVELMQRLGALGDGNQNQSILSPDEWEVSYLYSAFVLKKIAPRRGRPSPEDVSCVGNISKAMGPSVEPHVCGLLDVMFSAGLSITLVEALKQIYVRIPCLLTTIQVPLLECISSVLSRYHQIPELGDSSIVRLALQTLAIRLKQICFKMKFIFCLKDDDSDDGGDCN